MATVAYITDKKMIEYHRLNGNQTMNFWRPSSSKKMADFHKGDLLFFLSKSSDRKKEKGIIGYGRLDHTNQFSFNKMWNTYTTENGYAKKEDLYEAIAKVKKTKEFPKKLNCLYLTDVVYFQAPIYLSDFGIKISKSIESYIYLDKDNMQLTSQILNKAKEIGVDVWTAALSDKILSTSMFEIDVTQHLCRQISIKLIDKDVSEAEIKKEKRLLKKLKSQLLDYYNEESIDQLKGDELLVIDENQINLYLPIVATQKKSLTKTKEALGHAQIFKMNLNEQLNDSYSIHFIFVYDNKMVGEIIEMLEKAKISYLELS